MKPLLDQPEYDSRPDTFAHIERVRDLIDEAIGHMHRRGTVHDASKLEEPEKAAFDKYTPKLRGVTYGSDEYKSYLAAMKPALDRHYAENSHHPEHYRWHCPVCSGSCSDAQAPEHEWNEGESHRFCPQCCPNGSVIWECELMDRPDRGIGGMSLLDLIEALADWRAASERHSDGDLGRSLETNKARFGIGDQLAAILANTRRELGW